MLRIFLAAAVFASVPFAIASAQDPATPPAKPVEEVKIDPAVDAWIRVLSAKIADENTTIRASAQQGLSTVGAPAVPHLKKLSEGSDAAVAAEAKKVIERISRTGRRGEDENRPGRRAGNDDRQGGGARRGGLEQSLSDLDLNADQRAKSTEILRKHGEKMQELFGQQRDGILTREEMMSAFQELRQSLNKDMKGVLNEEQYKKFEEASRGTRGLGGGQPGGGQPGGGRRRGGAGGGGGGN